MSLLLPAHLESCAKPLVWTPRGGNDPQNREYKTAEGCMDHPEDTLEIVFGTQRCKTCLWTKYIWQKHCCCWGVKVGEMVVSLKWITEIMAIQLPPNFPMPCLVCFQNATFFCLLPTPYKKSVQARLPPKQLFGFCPPLHMPFGPPDQVCAHRVNASPDAKTKLQRLLIFSSRFSHYLPCDIDILKYYT